VNVKLSSFVANDLEAISDYISRHNPTRALTFVEELRIEIKGLAVNPFLYRLRPELRRDRRVLTFGQYLIVFRVVGDDVLVERVLQGARSLGSIFS